MNTRDPALTSFLTRTKARRARLQKAINAGLAAASALALIRGIPSLGKSEVTLEEDYEGGARIKVLLHIPETSFVRDLVKASGSLAKKAKSWDNKTLTASLHVEGCAVSVQGYKPETCAIVYEDVERVVEGAAVRADGSVVVVEKRARVVCSPQEEVAP